MKTGQHKMKCLMVHMDEEMRAFWLHNSDNHRESFYDAEKTSHILSNIGSRILHFTAATSEQPLSTRFDFSGFDFSLFFGLGRCTYRTALAV